MHAFALDILKLCTCLGPISMWVNATHGRVGVDVVKTRKLRAPLGAFVQRTLIVRVMYWKILISTERSCHKEHTCEIWMIHLFQEQDKSFDIEQQPPFGDRKISNIQPQNRGGGLQNQQTHHIILTKYEAVHPTAVSEKNSSSGMLRI